MERTGAVRIANCSGFYGDRLAAAAEMVDGGPIDVLSGDWLAELTMLILARNRLRDPGAGYARTFVIQMEQVMGTCLDRNIKVVTNAGGLAPAACADAVAAVADRLGLQPTVAIVAGDDLLPRLDDLRAAGIKLAHLDTREPLGDRAVMAANAYLGGWGIAAALDAGADVVITGRVTDAALTAGPAAWWHRWDSDDWDALAGAVVAGHIIECGPQATGGNYSFFTEIPGIEHPGFPIAEVAGDGSSVITKHPGHGGAVTVGTVTAQLLYEIGGPRYHNPDVTARFDTIALRQESPDRVAVTGARGESPPATTKVSVNYVGGWRTTVNLALTGLDIDAKAALFEAALWSTLPGGREAFAETTVDLVRTDTDDPTSNEAATAQLRITVKDPDEAKVGRRFTAKVTEQTLSSYPGLYQLSSFTQAYGVHWPAVVPAGLVRAEIDVGGDRRAIDPVIAPDPPVRLDLPTPTPTVPAPGGPTAAAPLGRLVGARSGDKGGNANVGVWARSDPAWAWLEAWLDTERFGVLLPETRSFVVHRYPLANLRAINFVVDGLLGEGVASSVRTDAQAKSLGEWLRARIVDIPQTLLEVQA
ncbi:MAG: DUF1446 domain-containing protein [Actinomycetota bacterium]|nr:DUF1446 domain-containing protein [Actinomycetota bacterium]